MVWLEQIILQNIALTIGRIFVGEILGESGHHDSGAAGRLFVSNFRTQRLVWSEESAVFNRFFFFVFVFFYVYLRYFFDGCVSIVRTSVVRIEMDYSIKRARFLLVVCCLELLDGVNFVAHV